MPLAKLSNGELVQIDLSHDQQGVRYARVYGVGWRIPKNSKLEREAHSIARLLADEVEVISYP